MQDIGVGKKLSSEFDQQKIEEVIHENSPAGVKEYFIKCLNFISSQNSKVKAFIQNESYSVDEKKEITKLKEICSSFVELTEEFINNY